MSKLRNTISNLFHPTAGLKKNNEDNIVNNIYSHDDIKQIIHMALEAEKPVHVLLTGEPGCGKTQFLENIKGYYKDREYFLQLVLIPQKQGCLIIYLKSVQE